MGTEIRSQLKQVRQDLPHNFQVRTFPNKVGLVNRLRLWKEMSREMRHFRGEVWHKDEIWASNSENYSYAFFGRDSLEASEDTLPFDTTFARDTIRNLSRLQGRSYNAVTEEEPGKIVHEFRQKSNTHPQATQEIFQKLHDMWGEKGTDFVSYYGSADATPLYIRLVADYCQQVGNTNILDEIIIQKDGKEKSIREVLWNSLEWLQRRVEDGPLGPDGLSTEPHPDKRIKLLEFKRMNEKGIENPIWKDSLTSVMHPDGTLANHDYPIATIELQGLAYDALTKGTELFKEDYTKAQARAGMLLTASEVQLNTLTHFWMPERNYFAVGLDRDDNGNYRQIRTIESNPAELLNTTFFDKLPEHMRQPYITGIVNTIYSKNFLTDVGVRCRSLEYTGMIDFWDYHGVHAVWPKETYDIAKGLLKQGFPQLAEQLFFRMRNGMKVENSFAELFYVDDDGSVAYKPKKLLDTNAQHGKVIVTTSVPEDKQTWSWSAYIASVLNRRIKPNILSWQYKLEEQLLLANPLVEPLSFRKARALMRRAYVIDQQTAFDRERVFKGKLRRTAD